MLLIFLFSIHHVHVSPITILGFQLFGVKSLQWTRLCCQEHSAHGRQCIFHTHTHTLPSPDSSSGSSSPPTNMDCMIYESLHIKSVTALTELLHPISSLGVLIMMQAEFTVTPLQLINSVHLSNFHFQTVSQAEGYH